MDILFAHGCAFIPSFASGNKPVRPVPIEKLARQRPEDVIYNLLARADESRVAGNRQSANALAAEAERLFKLVTAS